MELICFDLDIILYAKLHTRGPLPRSNLFRLDQKMRNLGFTMFVLSCVRLCISNVRFVMRCVNMLLILSRCSYVAGKMYVGLINGFMCFHLYSYAMASIELSSRRCPVAIQRPGWCSNVNTREFDTVFDNNVLNKILCTMCCVENFGANNIGVQHPHYGSQ